MRHTSRPFLPKLFTARAKPKARDEAPPTSASGILLGIMVLLLLASAIAIAFIEFSMVGPVSAVKQQNITTGVLS